MDNWDARIKEQLKHGWKNYTKKRLDLGIARSELFLTLAGDFLYVPKASSASALATIKLNRNTNESLDLKAGTIIKTVFTEFYWSNGAQSGEWIDVIIGVNFEMDQQFPDPSRQAQAVVEITHANPDTNQAGADQIAERVVITASPLNTDIAWLDFGQAAVQDSCYPLEAGDSVTVSISNLDQINCNFEVGGESVWIINEI